METLPFRLGLALAIGLLIGLEVNQRDIVGMFAILIAAVPDHPVDHQHH